MRILGIDYGDTRTGLAISDISGYLASPAGTINETSQKLAAKKVSEEAKNLKAEKIVLGMPRNMNGTYGERAEKTKTFAEILRELTGLEVILIDERLTTVSATNILNKTDTKGKKRKGVIDTLSACIILQSYLDSQK